VRTLRPHIGAVDARYFNDLVGTNREIATRLPPNAFEHLVSPPDSRPVFVDRRDPLGAPAQTLLCQTYLSLLLRLHRHLSDQVELADALVCAHPPLGVRQPAGEIDERVSGCSALEHGSVKLVGAHVFAAIGHAFRRMPHLQLGKKSAAPRRERR